MILANKNTIEDLEKGNIDFEYHAVDPREAWRIEFAKELIDLKHGELEVEGITVRIHPKVIRPIRTRSGLINHYIHRIIGPKISTLQHRKMKKKVLCLSNFIGGQ